MNIHYLQHVAFEDLAGIESLIRAHGHALTRTRLYDGEKLPAVTGVDFLIIMGGPMGVGDEKKHAWLREEKHFIERAITSGKTVLGVCLGAQLIANVLGARVYRNRFKEIGWFPVKLTTEGHRSTFFKGFDDSFMAFHWHGDTFDIPEGALHLARSEGCENQAFSYGGRVLALQMHLDSTTESIELLLQHCGDELTNGPYLQSSREIREGFTHLLSLDGKLRMLVDRLTSGVCMGEPVSGNLR